MTVEDWLEKKKKKKMQVIIVTENHRSVNSWTLLKQAVATDLASVSLSRCESC